MQIAKVFFVFSVLSSCASRENNANRRANTILNKETSEVIIDTVVKPKIKCDTTVKYDLEGISSEGAEAEVCYSGNKAIRATVLIYGAAGRVEMLYLFKPSFVKVKERSYQYQKPLSEIKNDSDIKLTDSVEYTISIKGDIVKGSSDNQVKEIYKTFLEAVPLEIKK